MCADAAMYAAKRSGGDSLHFFAENMSQDHEKRLLLGSRLRRALENEDGLSLVYQPIVHSHTLRTVGLEALVRWQLDADTHVSPGEFVPVAESTGFAPRLDGWVLARALRDLKTLRDAGHDQLRMAVNISARHVRDPRFVDTVRQLLAASDVAASALELEVTESALISSDGIVRDNLQSIHDMGIGVALDDFGTGYSSLSHLRRFPVTKLKIDRSFVTNAPEDEADAKLCAAIAMLGTGLGLDIVAEGVETAAQRDLFAQIGCTHLQGYLFSRPLPLDQVVEKLGRLRLVAGNPS
jgi:EAL domain-containing protein (putative c-di-GMP-specific phosphodiesterase class I)